MTASRAKQINADARHDDWLIDQGVILPTDSASSEARIGHIRANAQVCPECQESVDASNWAKHFRTWHKDKEVPQLQNPTLSTSLIRLDGGTQSRAAINPAIVDAYAEDMAEGAQFPSVVVFHDGESYWLSDGFHRVAAAKQASVEYIAVDVRQGTRRDAVLHSVGANATHGLRRTNEDKRRAVTVLLSDEEWAKWSDREISRKCGVHHEMVGRLRKDLSLEDSASERTYTTKHGTQATMNTANIGKAAEPENKPLGDSERIGNGDTVMARSGQKGVVVDSDSRIVIVETANGPRKYDRDFLALLNKAAGKTDEPAETPAPSTEQPDKTLYPATPSEDARVEQARQVALEAIGDNKEHLEDRIKGRTGRGSPGGTWVNFGGGELFLNYKSNGAKPSRHVYARNQVAVRLDIEGVETLFRFHALDLLKWKLAGAAPINYKRDNKSNRAGDQYVPQGYDACQTPAYAIDPLLPYLERDWTIWEPAAGEGLLVEALFDSGFDSVAQSDILTGQNFFEHDPSDWDCLVTNPPYSIKYEWLKRCYELGRPFALLVPVETIGAKTAQELMQKYGYEIMLLDQRVDFKMPNAGWDGAGSQFPVLWLCWQLLPKSVVFGSIEAGKRAFKP